VAASLLFLVLLAGSVHAAASDTRARAPRAAGITLSIDDVKVVEDEGDVEAFFTVTLSAPSASPVSVHYETQDGTATAADDDYAPTSGILTIPTNMLTGTITVTVIGDATFEGDETYTVDLSNPIGASIDDGQGLGTISNNDPTPAISIGNVTVNEGDSGVTDAVFLVTLSNASAGPVSFDYQTVDGTATVADSDYVAASGTATIPATTQFVQITVRVNADRVFEPTENFRLLLSNPTGASLANDTGTGTITNDDTSPRIRIDDVAVNEGNIGSTSFVFTVSLTNQIDQVVTVHYQTANGTATIANNDYQTVGGTVTIPAKASYATLTVLVNGDTKREGDEVFFVNLTVPTNATMADDQGEGTIQNDDAVPTISINDVTVTEGNVGPPNTGAVFTVSLSNPTDQEVTVQYQTADGTATLADADYQPASGTVTFPAKTSSRTLTVFVNRDNKSEGNETFFINLTSPTNATIADAQGQVTINNDDGLPTLSINDVTVLEGNVGTTNAVFTVSLSNQTAQSVTVDYQTGDGSATLANNDYQAASGTLTIPANTSSATLTVVVNGDTEVEPNETFVVNLSNSVNANLADAQGQGTIDDHDGGPVDVEPGDAITSFALRRVAPNPGRYGQPVTIEYALPKTASIRVSMVDVQGRDVAVLASGMTPSGRYKVTWNGNGDQGALPAGLYFVRYQFPGGKAYVQRLVLMR
jgi:hypothetical protein